MLSFENVLVAGAAVCLDDRWSQAPSRKLSAAGIRHSIAAIPQPKHRSLELGVNFINVAKECGLNVKTLFGGEHKNKYLLETTGCGVAFYDYDNDGWLDIFLVNGSRLEGFSGGPGADVASFQK